MPKFENKSLKKTLPNGKVKSQRPIISWSETSKDSIYEYFLSVNFTQAVRKQFQFQNCMNGVITLLSS